MLLRACPSASSHTRPQLREHDDAFVAVERAEIGTGWCGICRGGQEKEVYCNRSPLTVEDVDVKGLEDAKFLCPVWPEGVRDCGEGAGEGEGGGAAARARV